MKKNIFTFLILFFSYLNIYSQITIKTFGGSNDEVARKIIKVHDGNYLIIGNTNSINGDITKNNWNPAFGNPSNDIWVIKINPNGDTIWQKTYGGSNDEYAYSVKETPNNKFIIVGSTNSDDKDISTGDRNGATDLWVLKIDGNGKKIWDRCLGGKGSETAKDIVIMNNNHYLIAGYSNSASKNGTDPNCDRNNSYVGNDAWIVELDTSGKLIGEKSYGGNGNDMANSIIRYRNSYTAIGLSSSQFTSSRGGNDLFQISVDTVYGNNNFTSGVYGGSSTDDGYSIVNTNDNGLVYCTSTFSSDFSVPKSSYTTNWQAWIWKYHPNGSYTNWSKTYGGSKNDYVFSIIQTNDKGYAVVGYSASSDHDVSQNKGDNDAWFFKLDSNGVLLSSITLGGALNDGAYSIVETDSTYLIVGYTYSVGDDIIKNNGGSDVLFIKMPKNIITKINEPNIYNNNSLIVYPNPSQDIINIETKETVEKIEIFDYQGKSISNFCKISNNLIEIKNLSEGIYFLNIYTNNIKTVKKIIKLKIK